MNLTVHFSLIFETATSNSHVILALQSCVHNRGYVDAEAGSNENTDNFMQLMNMYCAKRPCSLWEKVGLYVCLSARIFREF